MGNSDSKKTSVRINGSQSNNILISKMELQQLKKDAIDFIRQRIAEKGLKEFYALEILESILPDATYTVTGNFRYNLVTCIFKWKTFTFQANISGNNQLIAKRRAAAVALNNIFGINLPVYDPRSSDMLFKKYESLIKSARMNDTKEGKVLYRASFDTENESLEAFGISPFLAKKKLFENSKIFYDIDSYKIEEECRKTLMSFVIAESDILENRLNFVVKHLLTKKNEKIVLESSDGVLSKEEQKLVKLLLENFRMFEYYETKKDLDEFSVGVKLGIKDIFRTNKSKIQATADLLFCSMKIIQEQKESKITKLSDESVAAFMKQKYGYEDDKDPSDFNQIKAKALSYAGTLLETDHSRNYESLRILQNSLDYINYHEFLPNSKVESTILWKSQRFSAQANNDILALLLVSAVAVEKLFDLPLNICTFSNRDKVKLDLISSVKYYENDEPGVKCKVNVDGHLIEAEGLTRVEAQEKVLSKAISHMFTLNTAKTVDENKRILVRALIKKDSCLIDRIKFVLQYLRVHSEESKEFYKHCSFGPTEDVLTDDERKFLIMVENKVTVEQMSDESFKGVLNINDNLLYAEATTHLKAKNETIIAAYEYIEKVNINKKCDESSIKNCKIKSNESSDSKLIEISISKNQPILKKVRYILENLRSNVNSFFKSIEELLTTQEHNYLIMLERALLIQNLSDGSYEAVITVNDNRFYGKSNILLEAKNNAILSAFEYIIKIQNNTNDSNSNVLSLTSDQSKESDTVEDDLLKTLKKRFDEYFPDLQKNDKRLNNPDNVWNKITIGMIDIQISENSDHDFTTKIVFNGRIFQETSKSRLQSRNETIIVFFKELLGIDRGVWPLGCLENENFERNEILKQMKSHAEDILKRKHVKSSRIYPVDLWSGITAGRFKIQTSENQIFTSKIIFFGKTFIAQDKEKKTSRHKVAVIALNELCEINLAHWSIFEDGKLSEPDTINDKERKKSLDKLNRNEKQETPCIKDKKNINLEEATRIYHERIKKLLAAGDNNKIWNPAKLWHAMTNGVIRIDSKYDDNANWISKIQYFDKKIQATSIYQTISRQKVAKLAFFQLFGVTVDDWKIYDCETNFDVQGCAHSLNRFSSESSLVKQKTNVAAKRHEQTKIYSKRVNEYLSKRNKQDEIFPCALWHIVTESNFPIKTSHYSGQYTSSVQYFDRTFKENGINEMQSRHKVAITLLSQLFGVYFEYWKKYNLPSKPKMEATKTSEERAFRINDYQQRAKEFLSSCGNISILNPASVWATIIYGKFPIHSKETSKGTQSTIIFFDKNFSIEGNDIVISRHKVATLALEEVFGIFLPQWEVYKMYKMNDGQTYYADTSPEEKLEQIRQKIKATTKPSIEVGPAEFWYQVFSGHVGIVSVFKFNGKTESTMKIFGRLFAVNHLDYKMSRNCVAALVLKQLFDVDFPHWKKYHSSKEIIDKNLTSVNLQQAEEIQDISLTELLKNPSPEKKNFSPEEISEIIKQLKSCAREIINSNDQISPIDLWNMSVNRYPEYQIISEFDTITEKYVAKIKFQDIIFRKENQDQIEAETLVACKALDELIGLEFNIDESPRKAIQSEHLNVEFQKMIVESKNKSDLNSSKLENTSDTKFKNRRESAQVIFYESLKKRIQTVLDVVTVNYLRSSFLQFKHSTAPVLTEDEWKVLKEIKENIFEVIDEGCVHYVVLSVFINDHQIFGKGISEKEATDAVIISSFEVQKLEVDIDKIKIHRNTKKNEKDIKKSNCVQKLKELHQSLRDQKKCLDDIPFQEVCSQIGVKFNLEFEENDNSSLDSVKEMTSRFILKKLLDIAYDIDD